MCRSPSVSRKPSAVSAFPRCDAGNSALLGSRGVALKARRGGEVMQKGPSVFRPPPSRQEDTGCIRDVLQGDCGYRTRLRAELKSTALVALAMPARLIQALFQGAFHQ